MELHFQGRLFSALTCDWGVHSSVCHCQLVKTYSCITHKTYSCSAHTVPSSSRCIVLVCQLLCLYSGWQLPPDLNKILNKTWRQNTMWWDGQSTWSENCWWHKLMLYYIRTPKSRKIGLTNSQHPALVTSWTIRSVISMCQGKASEME